MPEIIHVKVAENPRLRELAALEEIFQEYKSAWLKAAAALTEIREKQLWRDAGYSSWDQYCKERWGFGDQAGRNRIRLGGVVAELAEQGCAGILDSKAEHVETLYGFPPDMRKQIYETARQTAPGGKMTYSWIEQTGRRLMDARLAALKARDDEANTSSADDEDDEEEEAEEEAPPVSGKDQAIRDAAEHPITRDELFEKLENQARRWAHKGMRLAIALRTTPDDLLRNFGRPFYRYYKARNCAVVTIAGKTHYLGVYDSEESWAKYHRLIAEWRASQSGGSSG